MSRQSFQEALLNLTSSFQLEHQKPTNSAFRLLYP
jgi:hypothetical protein